MRIVHYSTSLGGGAGRAMINLNNALRACGADSWVASLDNPSNYRFCIQVAPPKSMDDCPEQAILKKMSTLVNEDHRTSISNTLFSADYLGVNVLESPQLSSFDVHNFHWVVGFVHPFTVRALLDQGAAVIWTLHDMWAFTGGCHYSAGCDRYTSSCHDCPQIIGEGTQLSTDWMEAKRFMLNRKDMTVTAPSKWLAVEASKSSVFRNARVEALPNTIDVNRFFPADPEERVVLRKRLGLTQDELVAVVISQNFEEQRKGYAVLLDALEDLNRRGDLEGKKLTLLCVGFNGDGLEVPGVRVIATGTLENDQEMRDVLAAADFAIQCALEENYSNVILETMACGLPVLASTAGGNAEMVTDRINGWLYPVEAGASGLARSLKDGVFASTFDEMRRAARATACDHDSSKIAPLYLDLYASLLAARGKMKVSAPSASSDSTNANGAKLKIGSSQSILEAEASITPPPIEKLNWQKQKSFSLRDPTPSDLRVVAAIRRNMMNNLTETYQEKLSFVQSNQQGVVAPRQSRSIKRLKSVKHEQPQSTSAFDQNSKSRAESLGASSEGEQPFNSDYVDILEQRMLRAYRHIRELDQTVRDLKHSEQALAQTVEELKQTPVEFQKSTESLIEEQNWESSSVVEASGLDDKSQTKSVLKTGMVGAALVSVKTDEPLEAIEPPPLNTSARVAVAWPDEVPISVASVSHAAVSLRSKSIGQCTPRVIRPHGIPELPTTAPFFLSPKFRLTVIHRKWLQKIIGPWFNPDWYSSRYRLTGSEAQNPLLHFSKIGISQNNSPSPMFDASYYLARYADVAASGVPGFWHFITRGLKEQRSPNPFFDAGFYLYTYPDVAAHKSGATAHFFSKGIKELRAPHVLFDPEYYLEQYQDVAESDANPLLHYLEFGLSEGRTGTALFDSEFYEEMYPEVLLSGLSPMAHFMKVGLAADYQPNALFDPEFYYERYADVKHSGMKAFEHFLTYGLQEHRQPHPLFDTKYYMSVYPDVKASKTPAYIHFLKYGMREDRRPHPLFDPEHYRSAWRDFEAMRMSPFEHFLKIGMYEGRSPNGLFSPNGFERLFGGKLRNDMPIFEQYLRYNLL
jgi:glycosyltransferase involved in cell wall biosynthesis